MNVSSGAFSSKTCTCVYKTERLEDYIRQQDTVNWESVELAYNTKMI